MTTKYASDTFTRANTAGSTTISNAAGWTTASDSETWSAAGGFTYTYSIASNTGKVTGTTGIEYGILGSNTLADGSFLVRVQASTAFCYMGVIFRYTDINNMYRAYIGVSDSTLYLDKWAGGSTSSVATATITAPSASTLYWVRAYCLGTTLKVKFWANGSGEPSTWNISTTDSSLTGAHQYGLVYNCAASGNTVQFDSYEVDQITETLTVGARTRLRVQNTKSVGARTRLSVLNTKSVGSRTRLSVQNTKSVGSRTRLRVLGTKTVGARTRLVIANTNTKTVGARTRLQVQSTKTVGSRARLSVLSSKSVNTRTRLSILNTKSVGARTRLQVRTTKTVGSRTRLRVLNSKTVNARTRLSVLGTKTVGARARLRATMTRTVGVRTRLFTASTRSVGVRVRLAALISGGFTCWANGTGTATFDHFRATEYPDPALSLAPVLPRLGNTTVLWDEVIPANTSRTVKTGLDGVNWTDVTSGNGGSIPGLTTQLDPTIDYFNSNTFANYTSTAKSGGSVATVTYGTANSRVTLSGGSGALYLNSALSAGDVDLIADMDESDAGGLVWRYVDTNNYYELGAYDDSSSAGFTNQLRLYKVVAGTRSLIGSASTISWPRNTAGSSPYKRIRVTMLGSTITVYFDGTIMQTATDATFASGKMGLRNDGGTSRYYQLRLQPVGAYVSGTPAGDIVTGQFVYTQVTLSTTDPTVNPQIQDIATSAGSPSVAPGSVITQLHDPTKPFAALYNNEMDTLTQASGDFYWAINNSALTFSGRYAVPSPWILHSSDLLFAPVVTPTFSADLYRNRQKITNCIGTVTVTGEQKIADGTATSWQMAYALYSAPTITVNGVDQTIGQQGVDTGKNLYWQPASNSISQGAGATVIPAGSVLSANYVGQYYTNVTRDNLTEQAARKAVEGGTGIVEAVEDGKQMLVSAAETYADGLLARFGNNNTVEIVATTRRAGAQKGQALPVFLPEFSINNQQLLITKITTSGEQLADGTILYEYQITATNGPNLNKWSTALGL